MTMKVISEGKSYRVPDDHSCAQAILTLAKAYERGDFLTKEPPARNDVKQLWRTLKTDHRQLLIRIALYPGIAQKELETKLGTDWQGLRGIHNGLARICETQGIEKPIRTAGYNKHNRSYNMDADVRSTILKLRKQ
jgi:hypothetical protein